MKRSDVINNANIRPGDVIVGLSSTGQATYEKKYNGGMGSNGLTSPATMYSPSISQRTILRATTTPCQTSWFTAVSIS